MQCRRHPTCSLLAILSIVLSLATCQNFTQNQTFIPLNPTLVSLPVYNKSTMLGCRTEQTSSFSVIFCEQRYLKFKNRDPMNTLEIGESKKLNAVRRVSGQSNILLASYLFQVGVITYNETTDKVSNYQSLFSSQMTQTYLQAGTVIDDFMMLDENIGVVKFVNNQTATFSLVSDGTSAKYNNPRTIPRFTGLQFDHERKLVYIGNSTHIQNLTVRPDRSPTTGQLMGIALVEEGAIRVNHTAFRITPEQYVAASCFNCSGNNGTIQVWDYTNISSPRLLLDLRGNSSQGSFLIGELNYLEKIATPFQLTDQAHLRLVYSSRPTLTSINRDLRQIQLLVSTKNSSTVIQRNEIIATGIPLPTLATMSFAEGTLLYSDVVGTNFVLPRYIKQCSPSAYFDVSTGLCHLCAENQGLLNGQCQECKAFTQQDDPFLRQLAFQVCSDPYGVNKKSDNGGNKGPPINTGDNLIIKPAISESSNTTLLLSIIIPVVLGVLLITLAVFLYLRCKKLKAAEEQSQLQEKYNAQDEELDIRNNGAPSAMHGTNQDLIAREFEFEDQLSRSAARRKKARTESQRELIEQRVQKSDDKRENQAAAAAAEMELPAQPDMIVHFHQQSSIRGSQANQRQTIGTISEQVEFKISVRESEVSVAPDELPVKLVKESKHVRRISAPKRVTDVKGDASQIEIPPVDTSFTNSYESSKKHQDVKKVPKNDRVNEERAPTYNTTQPILDTKQVIVTDVSNFGLPITSGFLDTHQHMKKQKTEGSILHHLPTGASTSKKPSPIKIVGKSNHAPTPFNQDIYGTLRIPKVTQGTIERRMTQIQDQKEHSQSFSVRESEISEDYV